MAAKKPNQDLYHKISTGANVLCMQLVLMAVAFVLSFTPLLGKRQMLVWRLTTQSALLAHASRLLYSVGLPCLKPFSVSELKVWFADVMKTSDIHYLFVATMFMSQRPVLPALVSPTLLAALRLAAFAKKSVPSLTKYAEQITSRQEAVFEIMAFVDILLLPMIILLAVLRRLSIFLPLVYLNLLWHRYHSPAPTGAKHHQKVWKDFDAKVQPYVRKAPPQVQQGIGFVQRYFTTPPAALRNQAQAKVKEQTASGKTQ